MKREPKIDWNNFTPHTRIKESQGKRMIPTFKPHPDWGYQWKPISDLKQESKQICDRALTTARSKHCW